MMASCVCESRAGGGMGGIMAAGGGACQCLDGMGKWVGEFGYSGIISPMFRFFIKITSDVVSRGNRRGPGGWPPGDSRASPELRAADRIPTYPHRNIPLDIHVEPCTMTIS